ncbi:MAG: tetratricopeptide repeat protein [Dermatophilus congolensis]|nr:tetratricopeptide repeat protein [Dermatophilus congolensis]
MTTTPAVRCTQTGCPGHYVDGYCDYCGFPAPEGVQTTSTVPTADATSTAESEAAQNTPPAPQARTSSRGTSTPSASSPQGRAGGNGSDAEMPEEQSAVVTIGSARSSSARRRVRPTRARTAGLGAGLTHVPTVPMTDPADAVMPNPVVAESKRNCPSCGAAVGRTHGDVPGRAEGYCPQCRNPYSFTPKLHPGDLVAGQYEIVGPLAHGGLGWIYLARDRNVSNRWVVLKGLLNAGDADAVAAAEAEQAFLARVEHPLIVAVYNVITHDGAGYTVMEYVGGKSLKQILKDRLIAKGGTYDPLPVEHALAYVLGILPAFAYMHDSGLLYCDFKPDNLIQVGDQVKLIDLGGMRAIDDLDSPIYGTVGYQAPEVAEVGPSIASDIYTIGRTLVVLTSEFRGYQSQYATSLPPAHEVPAFREHDPFFRLVAKACALDPADRFQSIEEFRAQLVGVLREVVSNRPGVGPSAQAVASALFEPPLVVSETLGWWELPALRADETDPMISWLAGLRGQDPDKRLVALRQAPERTAEVMLGEARVLLRMGRHAEVAKTVDEILAADPWDWRALWIHALSATDREDYATAADSFTTVYEQLPGEVAPHLALGLVRELQRRTDEAEAQYLTCLRCDASYGTAAAFGVARVRAKSGNTDGAIEALDLVPRSSAAHPRAVWLKAELTAHKPGIEPLDAALREVSGLRVSPYEKAAFRVETLRTALDRISGTAKVPRDAKIDGIRAQERPLRLALEDAYRRLAELTPDTAERVALVDKANEVRPWTLI